MVLETGIVVTTLVVTVLYMQQLEQLRQHFVHWYVPPLWFWLRRGTLLVIIGGLFYSLLDVTKFYKPEGYFLMTAFNMYMVCQIVIIRGLGRSGGFDAH